MTEQQENTAKARTGLNKLATHALTEALRRIYVSALNELQAHEHSVESYLQFSRVAAEARAKLFSGGDALTAATTRLLAAALATHDQAVTEPAADVQAGVLLVRVANGRFIATNNAEGPATFRTNVGKAAAAVASLERLCGPRQARRT